MAAKDDEVRIVFDSRPLAELLVARRGQPLFPSLPPVFIKIIYSRRILEGVITAFAAMGVGAHRRREYLARLGQEGVMIEAGGQAQVYADAARDEGIRLAVTARARGYVSSDADLVALKKWEGVEIMASVAGIEVEGAERDELVEVYYATTEQEVDMVINALARSGVKAIEHSYLTWMRKLFLGHGFFPKSVGGERERGIIGSVMVRACDAERAREIVGSLGFPWDGPPGEGSNKKKRG